MAEMGVLLALWLDAWRIQILKFSRHDQREMRRDQSDIKTLWLILIRIICQPSAGAVSNRSIIISIFAGSWPDVVALYPASAHLALALLAYRSL